MGVGDPRAARRLRPCPSPAGRGHRGRLGARLHAQPDQPDPRRAAGAAQGHRLQVLGRASPALRRHASGRRGPAAAPGALGRGVERHLAAGRVPAPRPTRDASARNAAPAETGGRAHGGPGWAKGATSGPCLPAAAFSSLQGLLLLPAPPPPPPTSWGWGIQTSPEPWAGDFRTGCLGTPTPPSGVWVCIGAVRAHRLGTQRFLVTIL